MKTSGSKISPLLPKLTLNRQFISEFVSADAPCFAIGLVEERRQPYGFMALRPDGDIPPGITSQGFRFGHSLLGNSEFEVIHFAFEFYGFKTYNALVNPHNLLVQAVLSRMMETGDYFFFALNSDGHATAFRSEVGRDTMAGIAANLSRIQHSQTTDAQYRKALASFGKNPQPPGILLHWVCNDNAGYLDLTTNRMELTPS